jgi:1-acyl-sn-glycerol-3-phosphate acyltransferase
VGIREADLGRFRDGLRAAQARQGLPDRLLRRSVVLGCRLAGWRVEAKGLAHLPDDGWRPRGAGCLIVAAPHRAWIDPFLLLASWPADAARLAWFGDGETMVRSWWRRWLFPRLGMIPIAPGSGGPRAYAEIAAEVLSAGRALALFPEKGAPSPPDATRTIAPGFAYLALRAGAPVVPAVLGGTHRIVRGSPFTVDLLPPILPGAALADAFSPQGRARARGLLGAYRAAVDPILVAGTALADARRPRHERWRWLATLFH